MMVGPRSFYFPKPSAAEEPRDLWELHSEEPGYRRELPTLDLLALYALSPSTERAVADPPTPEQPGYVLKVYGPNGGVVWHDPIEHGLSQDFCDLWLLVWTLYQQGKLRAS